MNIRLATPEDYTVLAEIRNIMIPDFPTTAEGFIHEDKIRDPKIRYCRWVSSVCLMDAEKILCL